MNDTFTFIIKTKDSTSPQCSPNPCKNGGICIIYDDGYYACICKPSYYGWNCQSLFIMFQVQFFIVFSCNGYKAFNPIPTYIIFSLERVHGVYLSTRV